MKKHALLTILLVTILLLGIVGTAQAEIVPPFGEGQIGLQAVVLCNSLTVRQEPSASSKAVQTLQYHALIIVTEQSDGWAYCFLGDAEGSASGWVNADYIIIDPAWYRTETKTPVYAWNDKAAPKVALLEANTVLLDPDTFLPILKEEGDWLLVSLRGAVGWIYAGKQAGERYEKVIMLEGMEETVQYEHAVNDAMGIAIDYEYESLVRRSESDRECFVSCYDDPNRPENYLEVKYSPADAEAAAASVSGTLSNDYDLIMESFMLDRAGSCIRIGASEAKGGKGTPDMLQMVYIIPAADGSIIATAHYSFESAEGFGARFRNMMHTLTVIDGSR
ncbi:MAG: SH3 domain-containing protein [Clostridia bacterium]|nr:SH3 domain-containing protein [Clostridia bacterium]